MVVEAISEAPSVIINVDDDQFYALLHDAPAAVIEWPDGGRTLLVLGE